MKKAKELRIKWDKTFTQTGSGKKLQTAESKCQRWIIQRLTTFNETWHGGKTNVRIGDWILSDNQKEREIYSSTKLRDCKNYANQKIETEIEFKTLRAKIANKDLEERGGKSDQERDELIEQILIKTQIENRPHVFSRDELNKYEAWLLMQKDFILTNKIIL